MYNLNGYKIVEYPARAQPFTVWKGNQVVFFCTTERELEIFTGKLRAR